MVSEGFQSDLKPCGFRVVSEWSETAWFQNGSEWSETVWFQRGLRVVEVSTPGVGWSWGSTLTPNYGGLGGGGWNSATQQLVSN